MRPVLPLLQQTRNPLLLLIISLISYQSKAQTSVKFGNSYVNISKKTVGGTVQPGDTLEIRTNYFFPPNYNGDRIYYTRYVDNIPSNTVYIGDSLRLITNEGLTFQKFTNAASDDYGTYDASPGAGEYNIRINIGTSAGIVVNNNTNATGGGRLRPNSSRPRVAGGLLLTTAFRVRVTGSVGEIITLGAGRLLYKKSSNSSSSDTIVHAIQYQILISNNDPICSNAIGKNFVSEAGGTFDSASLQNRPYGPTFLIPGYNYRNLTTSNQINDGYYTIVNNLSPWASTYQNAEKRPNCISSTGGSPPVPASCANRMFSGHWDIIGDHTGSATPAGNLPAASGTEGGYMLVVNADYATSEAYRQNITGLCPNTSYEFSLWVRNVCTNCGIDSTGTSTFEPGVYPNLTFAIDGLDRYSSGQIDTVGWIKKGFLFKTGSSQTSITISIRNNASGGGGNDWAIDDIALVTCNPDLNLLPSGDAIVCMGNAVDISCTVRAFFDNYVNYRWEKSIDNGVSWTVAGTGTGSPSYVSGAYQYIAKLPTFLASAADNYNQYRFIVASSAANLSDPDCSFAALTIIHVYVNDCSMPLNAGLLGFSGKMVNNLAHLTWNVTGELSGTVYEIERSIDQVNYTPIARVNGRFHSSGSGGYAFTDQIPVQGNRYYRIRILVGNSATISKLVLISNNQRPGIISVINPFSDQLQFQCTTPQETMASISIVDIYGKIVSTRSQKVFKGLNTITINNLEHISSGAYVLHLTIAGETIIKKITKIK